MVEPLPQNNQPQINQVPPTALGQQSSQQQPFHPMVVGQNYAPPPQFPQSPQPSFPPQGMSGQGKNKNIVTIGNLSLLAISSSLIFFGAFIFLAGFLLGMWLGSPRSLSYLPIQGGENGIQQQLPSFPTEAASPQEDVESQDEAAESLAPSRKSKHKSLTERAGAAAGAAVSAVPLPNVPKFLAPLLKETQEVLGKQAEYKAKQITQQAQKLIMPSPKSSPPRQPPAGGASQSSLLSPNSASLSVAPSQETSSPSSQKEEGIYSIQLGVYAAKENADALRNKLQALNYAAYVTEGKSAEGNMLYYVYSGRYRDYATGLEVASQFASQNIVPGAIVVKLSKNGKDGS